MDEKLYRYVAYSLLHSLKKLAPTWYPRDASEDNMLTRKCFKYVGQKTLDIVFLGEYSIIGMPIPLLHFYNGAK